ncbi:hypothetical protein [Candidatus Halobonum tyrrellensis]|uniref:hypothetical protein n=1 Tax=Candidatus Halobonum tyrrellensis TaxID=1431545 RepID=UPI00126840C8|nr:hypothetical protein [Candidatus Halobonum tyrrellensis]
MSPLLERKPGDSLAAIRGSYDAQPDPEFVATDRRSDGATPNTNTTMISTTTTPTTHLRDEHRPTNHRRRTTAPGWTR